MPNVVVSQDSLVIDPGARERRILSRIENSISTNGAKLRWPLIELGMSSPKPEWRLMSGRQLGRLLEREFAAHGLESVIEIVSKLISSPRLYYKTRDPRLDGRELNQEKAKLNLRLGVLMAFQAICKDQTSILG